MVDTDALIPYDELLKLDSKNGRAWYNKGEALTKLRRYQEASLAFDESIKSDPKNAPAVAWKGALSTPNW